MQRRVCLVGVARGVGVGVLTGTWRENVAANLASDQWLLWIGAAALAGLVAVFVMGVVEALRPPKDDD